MKLDISTIIVEDRLRQDLHDIDELAESIRADGLLQPPVVERLEDGSYKLIAGGRRMAALTILTSNKDEDPETYKRFRKVDFTVLNELSPAKRRRLELIENIQREDMTWQEKAVGLAEYHKLSKREAVKDGETWTQAMTGKLLNMSQASISIALDVADELKDKESPFWKCDSLLSAMQLKTKLRLDEANKELMKRAQARKAAVEVVAESEPVKMNRVSLSDAAAPVLASTPGITRDDILSFYYHGDCLQIMPTLAKAHVINHIITDPPYGIDMGNLAGGDEAREQLVARTANEHDVEGNLKLLPEFLRVSYDVIAEDGFLCMWYDLDHHEKIANWASKIGWKVCRWPIVWCKTSSCMNQAAQYNVTKATEVCYVLRRSEKSIIKAKQAKNFFMAPTASTSTHPFCKPYALWQYLIDTFTLEGQTILDPFAGEGSSLAAFFKSKRVPVGIECNEQHIGNGLSYIESQVNNQVEQFLSANDLL